MILFYFASRKGRSGYSAIVEFLLDHSGRPVNSDLPGRNNIWAVPRLQEKDVSLIMRLANSGFDFDISDVSRWTHHTKHNLLLLFSKNKSLVRMPEILRLICHENAADLRAALREGRVSASEKVGDHALLEWAFDWPEGMEVLLEFGADAKYHFRSLAYPGMGRHSSAALLLREGCLIAKYDLDESVSCDDGGERVRLLVNELAARRRRLRKLAEDSLPWASISQYGGDRILDGRDCLKVLELLVEHKISFPHSFTTQVEKFLMVSDAETVYHRLRKKQCAEALYQAGFLDTDMLDSKGNSPLSSLSVCYDSLSDFIEMVEWHVSNGADLNRRLPWANESASHLLASQMIKCVGSDQEADHPFHMAGAENTLRGFIAMSNEFFAPTRIPDGCNCPCSPDGCTTISVILREFTFYERFCCRKCVRGVFEELEEWDQSYWKEPQTFIRSLTFNALDLNHTCFSYTKKGSVGMRQIFPYDDKYINDNRDEQSALIEFEELVEELEQKFDELSLPLKEFLSGPWYRRVKDHLLTRQPYEEQAIAEARSIGVELEFCGLSVPDWVVIGIANKVEELSDEE
ncbi:unnamed protein product [Penicillium salamii]|uniref:Uncharacterized protein n=1 Tax=Penicillium salamii TaxID=1612424 RepID=A0A9W4J2C2_9EURO|nr:unnamed protein product [Penicillium salamii]